MFGEKWAHFNALYFHNERAEQLGLWQNDCERMWLTSLIHTHTVSTNITTPL